MCKDISTITAADADSISDYTFIQKEIDESFEQVLSRYMKELDIDISMLSKMTGISAGSIHYYKKGKRKISINHIAAICIAMRLYPLRSKYLFSLARYQLDFHSKRDLIIGDYLFGCAYQNSFSLKQCNAVLKKNHLKPLTNLDYDGD